MRIIFCADPWNVRQPEPMYATEVNAVEKLDVPFSLLNFEALVEQHNEARAVRRIEAVPAPELAIYRGWMLKPEDYAQLYAALAEKNLFLINMPLAYTHCHYLPESYALIRDLSPRTVWLRIIDGQIDFDEIMQLLQPFGSQPLIVKDFVKSRKHEWAAACYIPAASDREAVEYVVMSFVRLQGEDLAEGLVFREFLQLEPLGNHSKSGMPLTKEYRLFFCDGQHLLTIPYWEEGSYDGELPPLELLAPIARRIQSRFFTMDVAKQVNGTWCIVELGDGQVAGLPERTDVSAFYQTLIHLATP
ncbi:ATP-grasp domain-containing protein [Dictyobacter formicarum]|uniref:EF-hand domain-containing protein n=1 Tax=Dictyobacter formicarum TaxID=2778368 RepID=A0ABQ3VM43_9CHLR|nr:ATP-grasp domain-containing protein [Dictyobacter formicarum]GHO86779.1 hypothetical protein KSZ_47850 [Dictyobacter formicarum]